MDKQMLRMEELEQVAGGIRVVNNHKRDGQIYRNVKENLDNFTDDVADGMSTGHAKRLSKVYGH